MPESLRCCPLCRSPDAAAVSDRDREGHPNVTVLCLRCGLYRTDPMPDQAELTRFYRDLYRLEYKGVIRPKGHHVLRAARAARDRYRWLLPYLSGRRRWLDIGAGSGEFAFLMNRQGHQALALEPNRGYAGYIREALQVPVREGFLDDLGPESEKFDGISCFHVLEHHPNPVAALDRLRGLLAPSGILAVEVPNIEFPYVHPRNRFHKAHLVHFSLTSLALAAQSAGLRPLEHRTSGDGGVLWSVFEPGEVQPVRPLPGVANQAMASEKRRSAARYYGSPAVWRRAFLRLTALGTERVRALTMPAPKIYLSRLSLH
ncbi:MAG: methyltransferase domain-containing protein [Bryobacteraceae bacterium]|nr:methyltransferase domain-containing protein [Bryobacteraceae bacterium]